MTPTSSGFRVLFASAKPIHTVNRAAYKGESLRLRNGSCFNGRLASVFIRCVGSRMLVRDLGGIRAHMLWIVSFRFLFLLRLACRPRVDVADGWLPQTGLGPLTVSKNGGGEMPTPDLVPRDVQLAPNRLDAKLHLCARAILMKHHLECIPTRLSLLSGGSLSRVQTGRVAVVLVGDI